MGRGHHFHGRDLYINAEGLALPSGGHGFVLTPNYRLVDAVPPETSVGY